MNWSGENRAYLSSSLSSAGLLVALLVGIPVFLIFGMGWPLPQTTPSGTGAIGISRAGVIPSSLFLMGISIALWVLWLQVLVGAGVEMWAHFHGRVAPRVLFIPRFVQQLSARVIGTALVITFATQQGGTAIADNHKLLAPIVIDETIVQAAEQRLGQQALAEQFLGDANRWGRYSSSTPALSPRTMGTPKGIQSFCTSTTRKLQPIHSNPTWT